MVDHFLEQGFTYFDTAYPYHMGYSERVVKSALVERHPRESFLLADKINFKFLEKVKLLPVIHSVGDNTMSIYYTHWIFGFIIAEFCTIPISPVWNVLHALLLVAAGTLFGLVMKKVPILKHLVAR